MAAKRPLNSLLYGDVVFLHCKTGGYVFSEVSSTTCASIIVYPVSSKDENDPNFPNLKMAAFQVLAADKVKARQRLADIQQRLADIHKELQKEGKNSANRSIEETEILRNAEKNAEIEISNNKTEQERVAGTLVLYGSTIQLLHLFSGKYVAINPTETSKTEKINMQVELTAENSECTFFKILPRYKVKSVGHEVHLQDQVTFRAVKSAERQYLHTSRLKYQDISITLYGECHEVNIASVPSSYTLKPYHHAIVNNENENLVKAGSIIRLFHREIECYLVAEGSFANNKNKVMTEDVHLRKRRSDNGKLRRPSTSAITYWQIEKDISLYGNEIIWEERCRIKHLPTRMYLAVVKDENNSLKATLKSRNLAKPDSDIVFRLIPVIEEDDGIKFESYARINHPLTNSWLSAKQSQYYKQQFGSKATGLSALQWDTAELKEVGVTSEMNYDDAFTVEEVTDELVKKFNCVAEVVPVIRTYNDIEERRNSSDEPNDHHYDNVSVVIEALDVITEFIGSAHADLIDRQKLLRNLMVIDLIIKILQNYNPNASSDSPQQMISRACYRVLQVYLKGKSGKNDIYLARHIQLFRKHADLGLKLESMLTENNREIVLGYELRDIQEIIDKLLQRDEARQTQDSDLMDLLSALCVCNRQPIAKHQDYIVENLCTKEFFYSTEVGKNLIHVQYQNSIYFCKPSTLEWKPCSEGYQFLLAQLNLFGMLCKGNNKKAIEVVGNKFITFDEALAGVKDPRLDSRLRSKYLELIIALYVKSNDDDRVLLENLSLSFNYSEISENPCKEASKDPKLALTGAKNDHFLDLKEWIKFYLEKPQKVVGSKEMISDNFFTATVIDLLHLLVTYGYYANLDDIRDLMSLLLSLLDGMTDKPSIQAETPQIKEFNEKDRFKDTEENRPIFKIKVKILKIINLFFNFRFYLQLQNFICDYKLFTKSLPLNLLKELKDNPTSIHKNEELMATAVQRLEKIFAFGQCDFEKSEHHPMRLQSVLLDLTNYENDEILCESLHLLNRYYSYEDTLFEKALQTQLLSNPNSKKVLVNITNELLPKLRHLIYKGVNEEQFQDLISILRELIFLCHLKDAVHEPHSQNQQILYNTGIFSDIMSLIFRKPHKPKIAQDSVENSQQEIVSVSLQFLKLLARNHRVVQERLFYSMDRLLNLKFAIPDVAELLTEVFTEMKEICLKVEEKHIGKIFKLIVKYNGCPELLDLLQAIIKVEDIDLPLKQNQTVIVKYFNLNREKFCDSFLGKDSKKEQKRESLLLKADDSDYNLQVFLKVIDLLAACCEGKNLYIESFCQNMISISELMKILNNHEIKPDRKRPFVLFLLWAYINTGKNAKLTGSDQLTHSQDMWCYLEHINIVLGGIVRVMSSLTSEQAGSVKLISNSQLRKKIICKKIDTDTDHNEGSKDIIISHSNIPYVTNANGELIPGVLVYIMEGALPLIKLYYTKLFDPYKPDRQSKEIQVSANIASTLLRLADVMVTKDCFGSQQQWTLLSSTIITVISHECYIEGMIDVDIDTKARFNDHMQAKFSEKVCNKVVIQNNTTKAEYDEKKLNEDFNNFVKNFQLAYWGPNTAKHQIGSPYDTKYSDYVKGADFQEKGDEWLPLGSKYQKHVACFVSRQQSQTIVNAFTKRVIDYLLVSYNSFNYSAEKKQLLLRSHNIKYLQVLRTIVYNEIMFIDLTLQEQGHNPQKFRRQFTRVQEVQNQIQDFGDGSTVTKLVKLLSHPDKSISREVLALLAILLFSGNKKVQNSFASYLRGTKEDRLFVSMQWCLEQGSYNDSKSRELLVKLKFKHEQDQKLKRLYTKYAVRYGLSKASSPQSHASLSRIEEEPIEEPIVSSSRDNSLSYMKGESFPSIRVADNEIQKQKEEDGKEPVEYSKLPSLKFFRDTSYIQLTLRFLGLLCDRQNRFMQNYFREQCNNIKTVNLVSETCAFLQSFYVEVTKENIDLITEVLLTLIEMCVGNFANQQVIYKHHIVDVINRILRTTLFQQCSLSKVLVVKSTAVKILEIMCEETNLQSQDLVGNIFKEVDINALHASLAYFYCLSQDEDMKRSGKHRDAEIATFTTYHILVHFADFQDISMEMIMPKSSNATTAAKLHEEIDNGWKFCEKQSKSIEVSYKNDHGEQTLAKVHFRDHDQKTANLTNEIKEKIKINVIRSSPEDKLRDFSKWIKSVKREVQHLNNLCAYWPWFYTRIIVHNLCLQKLLFFWTLLMNILMIIAWESTAPKRRHLNETEIIVPTVPHEADNWFFSYVLYIGGSIHLLISLLIAISYFHINRCNFVMPEFFNKRFCCQHDPSYSDVQFFGLRTIYHLVIVIFSVLSLSFYGYFYCLCLFQIVVDNDILQRVLKSVTINGKSLLWLAALGLIVIYNYAVGTFVFMPNDFDNQDEGEVVRYCNTLFECSITVLEYGLLGTIGTTVSLPRNLRDATLRAIFYDLSFFVIVTTIGLNIVFGIILDAFSKLRDEKYNIEHDKKGRCFICNIFRSEFEKSAKGFDYHVENEHNMWDYIKYILYLQEIDVSDYNAIEYYVHQQIDKEDINFGYFPLFQARCLPEKKDDTLTELAELKMLMSEILKHHQEEQRNAAIQRNKEDHAEWERRHQAEKIDE